jgi:hypothetical protein
MKYLDVLSLQWDQAILGALSFIFTIKNTSLDQAIAPGLPSPDRGSIFDGPKMEEKVLCPMLRCLGIRSGFRQGILRIILPVYG